jgi:hypothetical protein
LLELRLGVALPVGACYFHQITNYPDSLLSGASQLSHWAFHACFDMIFPPPSFLSFRLLFPGGMKEKKFLTATVLFPGK